MSQAYVSQIMAFGFNFAPKNWAMCNGQIIPIRQNQALFSLLGNTYGGDGTTTFALPNLQSRVPLGFGAYVGNNYPLGSTAGEENVTLTAQTMPAHNHVFIGTNDPANSVFPQAGCALGTSTLSGGGPGSAFYVNGGPMVPLNPESLSLVGGGQAHVNIQPYLALNWCICQFGIFPSRN